MSMAFIAHAGRVQIAGVRAALGRPPEASPGCGSLSINVELAPFSSADWRPGRAPELVSTVSERLHRVLLGSPAGGPASTSGRGPVLALQQLCVSEGKAAWALTLDVYILVADGAVFDAVLLSAVAALIGTQVLLDFLVIHSGSK